MPVIGHALAGLALAAISGRDDAPSGSMRRRTLSLVVLSYAPDLASLLMSGRGRATAVAVSHSWLVAIAASAVLTPVAARWLGMTRAAGFAWTLGAIALHDGMDILQSPGRMPLWPWPWTPTIGPWIPSSLRGEVLACLTVLVIVVFVAARNGRVRLSVSPDWLTLVGVSTILLAAGVVSDLRDRRERDVSRARALAESQRYAEALVACDTAERWPSPAAPGRVEYIRAMAWWGLGERRKAETAYL